MSPFSSRARGHRPALTYRSMFQNAGVCSQEYEQGMDLEIKQEGSDAAMRTAARRMCDNYLTLVSMQKWHKDTEGDTMGTCSR